jgi:Mrp family chromosome partitioning ATPase
MEDHAPDLIQRAAARLQRPTLRSAGSAPITSATALDDGAARSSPFDEGKAIEPRMRPPHFVQPAPARLQQVTISPTSLAANGIVLPSSGLSRTVEEFRALKRHVLANAMRSADVANPAASRIILVTSARAGEGKTFTSVNLALALAYEKDARVMLMDADAYRQSLMKYLGISAASGWLETVSGKSAGLDDVVLETNVPGFSVLPTGKETGQIPEIMSSRRMKDLLDELVRQDARRFIIIDSLPCLTSTEPSILSALAGQTLFVVAAHQTSREDIEASLRLLNSSPSVNFILNKAAPALTEQFKGYGYAYRNTQ